MNHSRARKDTQRAFALPIVLLLLLSLTLVGISVAKRGNLEELMTGAQRDGNQALMNAESGLALAKFALDNLADHDALDQALVAGTLTYDSYTLTNYSLSDGTVSVVITDNPYEFQDADGDGVWDTEIALGLSAPATNDMAVDLDGRVVVTSVGNYNGAERVVQAVYSLGFGNPGPASSGPPFTIFAQDKIYVGSSSYLYGIDGRAHTNVNWEISGNFHVEGSITSGDSGNLYDSDKLIDLSGNSIDVQVTGPEPVPYVFPPIYQDLATRYLTVDCQVYDGPPQSGGNLLVNVGDGGKLSASGNDFLECKENDQWIFYDIPDSQSQFYYVESNVQINNSTAQSTPLPVSIVAEGYINYAGGNGWWVPYYSTNTPVDFDLSNAEYQALPDAQKEQVMMKHETILMAGGDMLISANPELGTSNELALVATHSEFRISGQVDIYGGLVGEGEHYSAETYFVPQAILNNGNYIDFVDDSSKPNEISGTVTIAGGMDLSRNNDDSGGNLGATREGWVEIVLQP